MKVVVAGGTGLAGRAICAALLEAGHEPVVLTRGLPSARQVAGVRMATCTQDPGDAWASELDGAGAVINLAGASIGHWPWTAAYRRTMVESRLGATRAIVDAIGALPADRRPRVLLNGSGSDVYEGMDAEPATESTPTVDTFLARLAVDWEREANRAADFGVRVVLLRHSLIIGRGAPALALIALPFRLFAGGRIGSGRQWYSWVDILDVAGVATWAIGNEAVAGPINVSAPDPRPQAEFARAIAAALRRPSWFPTPAWALRLVLGEQATLAVGSRRAWPERLLDLGYEFRRPRLEDALEVAFR